MTDKNGIVNLKRMGAKDLNFYQLEQLKRVRLVKIADGYYCQFAISVEQNLELLPTDQIIGLDIGLESLYTDLLGNKVENLRFYRTGKRKLKRQ